MSSGAGGWVPTPEWVSVFACWGDGDGATKATPGPCITKRQQRLHVWYDFNIKTMHGIIHKVVFRGGLISEITYHCGI